MRNNCCLLKKSDYTAKMKFGAWIQVLVMLSALLVIGTGCGGLYASPSFSPLMLLVARPAPTKPALPQPPVLCPAETNQIVALAD